MRRGEVWFAAQGSSLSQAGSIVSLHAMSLQPMGGNRGLGGRLFITGASGYVGRQVVATASAAALPMALLVRAPASLPPELRAAVDQGGVEIISGELCDAAPWQARVQPGDVVLHLAAATGKATAREHTRINVEGTRSLAQAAAAGGAAHFVLVSSIATRFPDQTHYPYAHAKSEAERCVREGPLPFTIVRPTLVVGPNAPVLQGFALLAGLPITPVFGDGQRRIQPIDVNDLAAALVALCAEPPAGETLELGGPERVTIDAWMHRIRGARGAGTARLLHLPLVPIRSLLAFLEPLLLPVLPLTAGQLATFANDGVAEPCAFMNSRAGTLHPLDISLTPPVAERLPPTPFDAPLLGDECRALCQHLIGAPPSDAMLAGYLEHHRRFPVGPFTRFENELIAFARRSAFASALADAYSVRFLPNGLLRRKLVLLLALLETDPELFPSVDAPDAGGGAIALMRLMGRGATEVGLTALAVLWLGPRHLLSGRGGDE